MVKVAFITGINGQDGSYLCDLLLAKGYHVHGIIRRKANPEFATVHIDHHREKNPNFFLYHGDLLDSGNLANILHKVATSNIERLEIYNLAALSHVKVSFECPEYAIMVNGVGTLKLLEAIRSLPDHVRSKTRFYQASTSELYGDVLEKPQSETTPFNPVSPYAASKLYAFAIVKNYREAYGLFCCNGILFNHESPRRGMDFVTRKITVGLGKILRGEASKLVMGNIDSVRDWGHARDYVMAMWLMLQAESPDDFVIATGQTHSVREFIECAFSLRGINISWVGSGVSEIGKDQHGRVLVEVNGKYFRPCEVCYLEGNASKAEERLGWLPSTSFEDLVREMVDADCPAVAQ